MSIIVDMTSEERRNLPKQPAPTCPVIDGVLSHIEKAAARVRHLRPKYMGEEEMRSALEDIEVHTGTIYKAAGWRQAENYVCRTRTWTGWRNRPRRKEQGIAARMRWEMDVYQGGGE